MTDQQNQAAENANQEQQNVTFDIRKIYLKDASVESPNAPEIFLTDNKQPEISIDASIKATPLEQETYYDVVLGLTVTSKIEDKTAFLVEVQQAGVFQIMGMPESDLPLALQIACPNVLLPFAREAIADLVAKAGFPQLLIAPINFESLYQQQLEHNKKAEESATSSDATH